MSNERRRCGMNGWAALGMAVAAAVVVGAVGFTIASWPDLKRYMKIRSM
jgi:hypothetical protein